MRTVDCFRFAGVFVASLGYVLVLSWLPLDASRAPLLTVFVFLTVIAVPWYGYYFVLLRTPAALRREPGLRHSFAALVGLALAVPTLIALLIYALAISSGGLAD